MSIQIFVKINQGQTRFVTLNVNVQDNVATIVEQIEQTEGIPAQGIRLLFRGRQLNLARSLSDYNIQAESVILILPPASILNIQSGQIKVSRPRCQLSTHDLCELVAGLVTRQDRDPADMEAYHTRMGTNLVDRELSFHLYLSENSIHSVECLASLPKLVTLDLSTNEIQDVSKLASLTNLLHLNLSHNQITDYRPLLGLTQLKDLDLSHNPQLRHLHEGLEVGMEDLNELLLIGAITRLLISLPNLEILHLEKKNTEEEKAGNNNTETFAREIIRIKQMLRRRQTPMKELHISNISCIWNCHANIDNRALVRVVERIQDLSYLRLLDLSNNQIVNASPLQHCEGLIDLNLESNGLRDVTFVVPSLVHLRVLNLNKNRIQQLKPLRALTNLKELRVDGNQIQQLVPLEGLTNLERLSLKSNRIQQLKPLRALTNLKELQVGGNKINNMVPLEGLTNLELLSLKSNRVVDVEPLARLSNLKALDLGRNQIQQLEPLQSLTKLTVLWASNNRITDVAPLARLTSLVSLSINSNRVINIEPLQSLPKLTRLIHGNNPRPLAWRGPIPIEGELIDGFGAPDPVEALEGIADERLRSEILERSNQALSYQGAASDLSFEERINVLRVHRIVHESRAGPRPRKPFPRPLRRSHLASDIVHDLSRWDSAVYADPSLQRHPLHGFPLRVNFHGEEDNDAVDAGGPSKELLTTVSF